MVGCPHHLETDADLLVPIQMSDGQSLGDQAVEVAVRCQQTRHIGVRQLKQADSIVLAGTSGFRRRSDERRRPVKITCLKSVRSGEVPSEARLGAKA